MSENHGQWQAQGKDIPERGHRVDWGSEDVPTKRHGLDWLQDLSAKCSGSERKRRQRACSDATRFVKRCPAAGYPSTMKTFYGKDDAYPNARIDLEIYGHAFRDPEVDDG